LIDIHEQSCIDDCDFNLYKAKLCEINNDKAQALKYYQIAMMNSPRAIEGYYLLFGDNRGEEFKKFATYLEEKKQQMSVEAIAKVGEILTTVSLTGDSVDSTPKHDDKVDLWLDAAMSKGSGSAYKSKIQYALSFPAFYNPTLMKEYIDSYQPMSPLWAEYFRAQSYLVLEWRNINPAEARKLLEDLKNKGFGMAYLGLAKLKSTGVEDEVDQVAAIHIYEKGARRGVSQADYQAAVIYGRSKGICRDYIKAYAHNRIAINNGVLAAIQFESFLRSKLSEQDLKLAEDYQRSLLEARLQ
jgi:TPR repeat protein